MSPAAHPPIQRYVIVVHGMGEARKNETVLAVASRFAEARRGLDVADSGDTLTLGMASSQTGKEVRIPDGRYTRAASPFQPWLEFCGIPASSGRQASCGPFLGEASNSGDNLRFADCTWSDLSAEDFAAVGQPPEVWTQGVLGRLERKAKAAAASGSFAQQPPVWALAVLQLVRDTAVLIHRLLAIRVKWLDDTIFSKYLGDVQLYGEYSHLRGRSVRRFHRLLWRIERKHNEEQGRRAAEVPGYVPREARYTVIAHSLGSVMAMDALLYAHASLEARLQGTTPAGPVDGFPFGGFSVRDAGEVEAEWQRYTRLRRQAAPAAPELDLLERQVGWLDTSWVDRVDSLVTMGSPIDKFLVIWWLNYRYLAGVDWLDLERQQARSRRRISQFNYCDEQDPVGHNLDVAKTAPAFGQVFQPAEDVTYLRHPVPGAAHVSYWRDLKLFKRILACAVDDQPSSVRSRRVSGTKIQPWDREVYDRVLDFSYGYLPVALILAQTFAFTWAWYTESWHARLLAISVLLGSLALSWRLVDLGVWWRQILRRKREKEVQELDKARTGREAVFRLYIWVLSLFLWLNSALYWGLYLAAAWPERVPKGRAVFILMASVALLVAWMRLRGHVLVRETRQPGSALPGVVASGGGKRHLQLVVWILAAIGFGGWLAAASWSAILNPIFTRLYDFGDLSWPHRVGVYGTSALVTVAAAATFAFAVFNYQRLRFLDIKRSLAGVEADFGKIALARTGRIAGRAIGTPIRKLRSIFMKKAVPLPHLSSTTGPMDPPRAGRALDFASYVGASIDGGAEGARGDRPTQAKDGNRPPEGV